MNEISQEAARAMLATLKECCDPVRLREAILMTGAHISQSQTLDMIEEDRLGVRVAIERATF